MANEAHVHDHTLTDKGLVPSVPGAEPRCPRCGAHALAVDALACRFCGVDFASSEARAGLVAPATPPHEFVRGVAYLPRGFWRIVTAPRTWGIVAITLTLNVVFAVGVTYVAVPALENWLTYTTAPNVLVGWNTGWWRVARIVVEFLGWLVRALPYFTVPGITAWVLSTPPFRVVFAALGTLISDRVERAELGERPAATAVDLLSVERSIGGAILGSLFLIAAEAALYVLLLPLALLPMVGTFAWLVIPRAVFSGLDLTDPTLCRKVYRTPGKIALWWSRRWRLLGFGSTFFFLLGTPGVNAVVIPIALAGAALLYLELDRK
jgi:uncharacterized protein involved in cysteine biosynthesis